MARFPGLTTMESPSAVAIHVDRDMKPVLASAFLWFGVLPSRIQAASNHSVVSCADERERPNLLYNAK
jgi:hypothetical protein